MLQSNKILPVFVLLASLLVVYFAVPRFIASLYYAYPKFIVAELDEQRLKLAAEAYPDLYHSLQQANDWAPSAFNWYLQVMIELDEYFAKVDKTSEAELKVFSKKIESDIIQGLSLSPIDPYSWFLLANIRSDEGYPIAEVLEPLKMSIYCQRMAPELFIRRISLLLQHKQELDEVAHDMLIGQINLAKKFNAAELKSLLVEYPDEADLFNE